MKMLLPLLLVMTACTSAPKHESISPREYERIVKAHTKSTDQYQGLYQTFQAHVTLLTTDQQTAALKRRGDFLGWDAATAQKERDRVFQEMSTSTRIFLRFFSPENDYDDLHKPTSIWKVYLEYDGRRLEGRVRKLADKLVELKMLYPYFDRFSSPYEVSFPVPTTAVEAATVKVVLTSSLGTAEFPFTNGR